MSKVCPCCNDGYISVGDGKPLKKELCRSCKNYNKQLQAELAKLVEQKDKLVQSIPYEVAANKRLREALETLRERFRRPKSYKPREEFVICEQALKEDDDG